MPSYKENTMKLSQILTSPIQKAVKQLFDVSIDRVEFQITRKEFEGDITMVIFPLLKVIKGNPMDIGTKIGNYLVENVKEVIRFNVVSGFLNIVVLDDYYRNFFNEIKDNESFGFVSASPNDKAIMVEYSSPNTNKPLHLGHVRNNLLGYSVAEIIKASGKKVYKTQIINDRGIHICKSMLAWQKFGNGQTPETAGLKGDKLVGNFYVKFDQEYKSQIAELITQGKTEDEAKKLAPIILEAQQMLLDWEAGKPEVIALWKTMNQWVYKGFAQTYKNLGVDFDSYYYESNTYLLGKNIVQKGLEQNVFYKKDDRSVWINLTDDGLDEKLVMRRDGTSVYITQDIGLAEQKYNEYNCEKSIYVIGDEQNYHMKVLKLICQKLQLPSADGIEHLSYGMVELTTGKMKSREGTVVDADDIVSEMIAIAKQRTEELGKVKDFTKEELEILYKTIGLGALKFFLLRVDPKKRMIFNPEESIDFHGFTGPFIQYTHARIKSVLRKVDTSIDGSINNNNLLKLEKDLIICLEQYATIVNEAMQENDPSKIAIYIYQVAKTFNSFYTEHSIVNAETEEKKKLRLQLALFTAKTIKSAMHLLGIDVPERM